jgi:hypothetical protein
MACDAATLEAILSADKLPQLSDRDRLMCLASVYGTSAGLTGQQALDLAYQDGLAKLSDRELEEVFLSVIC